MAHSVSARKRVRQAAKRRGANASMRSIFRTSIKKVVAAIEAGDKNGASAALQQAIPVIDRTAGKGLIHRNKAARHKARLSKRIEAL
ncbi:MAG: 30S ribosomal protein S20 [Pseudomonadota bacterium]